MKNSMPVVSPYLERLWNQVLAEKGWNAKQLAKASGVSYGYARKIVNGTLIPSRDALRRMCRATGLDFADVWRAIHSDQAAIEPAGDMFTTATRFFASAREKFFESPEEEVGYRGLTRKRVNEIEEEMANLAREKVEELMNTLPLAGMAELLHRANELSKKYNPEP